MNPSPPILVLGLALGCLAAARGEESAVRFSNNDRLAGSMDSLSAELLVWNSPALAQPTPFFLRNVLDLTLPTTLPPAQPEGPTAHEATLKLSNGDTVCGQLASVTDKEVALDTWFAGRLKFNRLMVTGVTITGKSSFVYRGPSSLDGWQQSGDKPAWRFSRAAFRADDAGGIARDNVLPDECAITFDVAWKGDGIGLKLIAFSAVPTTDNPSSGYELSFQRGSIALRNGKTKGFVGSTSAQVLMENDKVHIEVRASRKSGKVCLYVDDRLIENLIDPDVAKGKYGRCLHFISQNQTPMRISGISVAAWDGAVEPMKDPRVGMMGGQLRFGGGIQPLMDNPPATPAKQDKPKDGRMELANGDSLAGEVASITDGQITVKTPLGDVKIPVARLRTLAMKKVDVERCKRRNGDIRAWFPDGSSIVFRLDSVNQGSLSGSSQNFGSANFKLSAFNRIEFNIHNPDFEDKRTTAEW